MNLERFAMMDFQYPDQTLMTKKKKDTKSSQNRINVKGKASMGCGPGCTQGLRVMEEN